jgi:hypothetical protein
MSLPERSSSLKLGRIGKGAGLPPWKASADLSIFPASRVLICFRRLTPSRDGEPSSSSPPAVLLPLTAAGHALYSPRQYPFKCVKVPPENFFCREWSRLVLIIIVFSDGQGYAASLHINRLRRIIRKALNLTMIQPPLRYNHRVIL